MILKLILNLMIYLLNNLFEFSITPSGLGIVGRVKIFIIMCLQSIYDDNRNNGKSPQESSISILDILTDGLWTAWEKDKVNQRIEEIIEHFEKPNHNTNEK